MILRLEDALAAWRRSPNPTVAEAACVLDEREFAPPKARTKVEFHAAWLALAESEDPAAWGWLARTLRGRDPGRRANAPQSPGEAARLARGAPP